MVVNEPMMPSGYNARKGCGIPPGPPAGLRLHGAVATDPPGGTGEAPGTAPGSGNRTGNRQPRPAPPLAPIRQVLDRVVDDRPGLDRLFPVGGQVVGEPPVSG